MNEQRLTGQVARTIVDKGFGFIVADGSKTEYFFHRSTVRGNKTFEDLAKGQKVAFTVGAGAKGPRAENVEAV